MPWNIPVDSTLASCKTAASSMDEINQRLLSAGFDVDPPEELHGAWTFYFHAQGGFDVEVYHQFRRGAPEVIHSKNQSVSASNPIG